MATLTEQSYHAAGGLLTFAFAWVGIVVALTVNKCSHRATSLLSLFSGGVLLGGGTLHLLNDSVDTLREDDERRGQLKALLSFSITYLILLLLHVSVNHLVESRFKRTKSSESGDTLRLMVVDSVQEDEEDETYPEPPNLTRHLDEHDVILSSLRVVGVRSSVMLMGALCFHSFLAGLAFGSQPDPAEEFKIMIPVTAHKSLAAVALTTSLKNAKVKSRNMFILLLIFSLSTPAGTLAGVVITSAIISKTWTGVCLGIAGGTFIFVTLNDIIPGELSKSTSYLVSRCCAVVLGFTAMAVLAFWV